MSRFSTYNLKLDILNLKLEKRGIDFFVAFQVTTKAKIPSKYNLYSFILRRKMHI